MKNKRIVLPLILLSSAVLLAYILHYLRHRHEITCTDEGCQVDVISRCNVHWSNAYDGKHSQSILLPDEYAKYWLMTLPMLEDEESWFSLSGPLPVARYASLQSYDELGFVIDGLAHHELQLDDNQHFNVKLEQAKHAERSTDQSSNTLFTGYVQRGIQQPQVQAQKTKVVLRTYLANPDHPIKLPKVIYHHHGTRDSAEKICDQFEQEVSIGLLSLDKLRQIERISDHIAQRQYKKEYHEVPSFHPGGWYLGSTAASAIKQVFDLKYFQLFTKPQPNREFGLFPNIHNNYLIYFIQAAEDKAVVFNFRRPRVGEDGEDPDVLYWSFSSHQIVNFLRLWGTLNDTHLAPDTHGSDYSTLVMVPRDYWNRLPCSKINDMLKQCRYRNEYLLNITPYTSSANLLVYRQLLASPQWPYSVSEYAQTEVHAEEDYYNSEKLQQHMGEYYPRALTCSLDILNSEHCDIPFNGRQSSQ